MNEGPLTIGEIVAKVETRKEVPPKMLLNSTTDYYSVRASLGRTGASGTDDQPPSRHPQTFACMLIGSFQPFAVTREERERMGDARLSIEERYHGRDDYVNRVRVASQDFIARGFLLPEDAAVIIQEAASSTLFAPAHSTSASR